MSRGPLGHRDTAHRVGELQTDLGPFGTVAHKTCYHRLFRKETCVHHVKGRLCLVRQVCAFLHLRFFSNPATNLSICRQRLRSLSHSREVSQLPMSAPVTVDFGLFGRNVTKRATLSKVVRDKLTIGS
mmetsp:Transcript_75905/g.203349  ORF Transcript_75905/g.203349 Transcript_75905/m.203349 type:complete len:128 (-) Transcript_75905:137-520(-)